MGRIYDVLRALGIRRTYKGYYYVADAVRLVMTDASRLLYICLLYTSDAADE